MPLVSVLLSLLLRVVVGNPHLLRGASGYVSNNNRRYLASDYTQSTYHDSGNQGGYASADDDCLNCGEDQAEKYKLSESAPIKPRHKYSSKYHETHVIVVHVPSYEAPGPQKKAHRNKPNYEKGGAKESKKTETYQPHSPQKPSITYGGYEKKPAYEGNGHEQPSNHNAKKSGYEKPRYENPVGYQKPQPYRHPPPPPPPSIDDDGDGSKWWVALIILGVVILFVGWCCWDCFIK